MFVFIPLRSFSGRLLSSGTLTLFTLFLHGKWCGFGALDGLSWYTLTALHILLNLNNLISSEEYAFKNVLLSSMEVYFDQRFVSVMSAFLHKCW